jgi:hypothetical protein
MKKEKEKRMLHEVTVYHVTSPKKEEAKKQNATLIEAKAKRKF